MAVTIADRLTVRAILENWVLWRDSRDWERFRALWHKDGMMSATWFQGPYEDFIAVSEKGFREGEKTGSHIMHMLGAVQADIKDSRAIAQCKMAIMQRGLVDGVMCDVTCHGRFYTFIEKRRGRWGLVLLRPIYEKDRLDPVEPDAAIALDAALLGQYPTGYRHLAYLQAKAGFDVKKNLPGLAGPSLDALNAMGKNWLAGKRMALSVV